MRGQRALFGLLALAACTADGPAALVLELSSDLSIPGDTNNLAVRLRTPATPEREESYLLGEPPRDRWPQILPVVASETHPKEVGIAAELRVSQPGRPSVVVGFTELSFPFPRSGTETQSIRIARACVDDDGDGHGVGFGCERPDCDDARRDIPESAPCPGFAEEPGPADGGASDAGVSRADAGAADGGRASRDAGSARCGTDICEPDEVCHWERCWRVCETSADCGEIHLGCVPRWGICMCRVPCRTTLDCGAYECVDGCCRI